MFQRTKNIKSRRGYARAPYSPGVGLTLKKGSTADTDFLISRTGTFVIRFSSQGYVYWYERILEPGLPGGDDCVDDDFMNDVGELLMLWLIGGVDYSPFYYLQGSSEDS